MKFKLDENLGRRGGDLLTAAGHDVATVFDQNLNHAPDTEVIEACRQELRCLVTLDLDFGNPLRFNPAEYCGIAVLRLPARCSYEDLIMAIKTLAKAVERDSIEKKLWIVERGRIRIYRPA
jgi:predicted nuclease of predicted toxin-antitoxin system